MKKILLFISLFVAMWNAVAAQTCQPAQNLPDTVVGVIPFPYDRQTNPTGGITDTACVNEPFRFVFTLVVPDTFRLGGVTLPLNSIDLGPTGAIRNLPRGIGYVCNPPNCVFQKNTKGCVLLSGTVNDTAGVYDLQISGIVRTGFLDIPLTFPNAAIFPGNYFLHVKRQGQCRTASVGDLAALGVSAQVRPNPFSSFAQIMISTPFSGEFDLIVTDLLGRKVHRQRLRLLEGENTVDFDGSDLSAGIYIYTLTDGERQLSDKMVLNRN